MSGKVEFDHIAPFYDETRPAPAEEEMGALAELLEGCRSVVDAGVGTGRFALPLIARGIDVVGVDLSVGMMGRARAKGVHALIRGDIRRLPIADERVDAGFLAHVLQPLPDPGPALPGTGPGGATVRGRSARRLVRRSTVHRTCGACEAGIGELAAELGHPLPARGERYSHTLAELSEIAEPSTVRVVARPRSRGATAEERLARWQRLAFGGPQLPAAVHAEIVRRLEAERPKESAFIAKDATTRFVLWEAKDLRATR